MVSAAVRAKAVVLFCLFIVAFIVVFCVGIWFLFCNAALSVLSSFAIISLRWRELIALL